MIIQKDDLVLKHYSWHNNDIDGRHDISPSRKLFDRNNGFHILWVTNWYAAEYVGFQTTDISKLEMLISDQLPTDRLSEKSVYQWLVNTWHG